MIEHLDPHPMTALPDLSEDSSLDGPTCVGLVIWRPGSGGRELATLEVDGRLVLPKGLIDPDEPPREAIERLALGLAASRVDRVRALPESGPASPLLPWWEARWAGLDATAAARSKVQWLSRREAELRLDHQDERAIARGASRSLIERFAEERQQRRERLLRAEYEELAELERRIGLRPAGPAGPITPSWRDRALELTCRAGRCLGENDLPGWRRAVAEASRLELFGLAADELEVASGELLLSVERELATRDRAATAEWCRAPHTPAKLERAARAIDEHREARTLAAEDRHQESRELTTLTGLLLFTTWVLGSVSWMEPGSVAPSDPLLASVLLGGLGATASCALAPGRGPTLLRVSLGAVGALLLTLLLRAGILSVGIDSAPGWLVAAFAAGFLERLVARSSHLPD